MPSKKSHTVNVKGELDLSNMEITDLIKDKECTYDFEKILRAFDGKHISVTIKEEFDLPVKDEVGE
jgi:YonK protein